MLDLSGLILFDCSQFISFDGNIEGKQNIVKQLFFDKGFEILINNEIELKKRNYFREEFLSNTIEMVDQEFFGEFNEWEEKTKVPSLVNNFIAAILDLAKVLGEKKLRLILVESVYEIKEKNDVLVRKIRDIQVEDFFVVSWWSDDYEGNKNYYIFDIELVDKEK